MKKRLHRIRETIFKMLKKRYVVVFSSNLSTFRTTTTTTTTTFFSFLIETSHTHTHIQNRGYVVLDTQMKMSPAEYETKFGTCERSELTISVDHKDDKNHQCYVFFLEDKKSGGKVGMKEVKDKIERVNRIENDAESDDEKKFTVILVVEHGLSGPAASQIPTINAVEGRIHVEYFKDSELVIDITEHELVPEHTLLTEQQKQTLLNRYKLKEAQLPKIQVTDPVARYLGLKRGQVVRITRSSETAGEYVTYRICIDPIV